MLSKISSKHQVVIPKQICAIFGLVKGDLIDFTISGRRIIMVPKEVIVEDKYPLKDLEAAEEALSKGLGGKRVSFKNGKEAVHYFKNITKKK